MSLQEIAIFHQSSFLSGVHAFFSTYKYVRDWNKDIFSRRAPLLITQICWRAPDPGRYLFPAMETFSRHSRALIPIELNGHSSPRYTYYRIIYYDIRVTRLYVVLN